jgi:poly(hydroxyalkanoate) granule-associated protein
MPKKPAAAAKVRTAGKPARRAAKRPAAPEDTAWPAPLGALAKAQQEGVKVIESLRKHGQRLEQKTREAAADTAARAREMQQFAGGTLDKLEQVFEERVARALSKLGVHTQNDVQQLVARVDALSEAVNRLIATTPAEAGPARKSGRRASAGKKAPAGTAGKRGAKAGQAKASQGKRSAARRAPAKGAGAALPAAKSAAAGRARAKAQAKRTGSAKRAARKAAVPAPSGAAGASAAAATPAEA